MDIEEEREMAEKDAKLAKTDVGFIFRSLFNGFNESLRSKFAPGRGQSD